MTIPIMGRPLYLINLKKFLEAFVNREQKKELVESLHKTFLESSSIIVTHINGLTVAESTELRKKCLLLKWNFFDGIAFRN